MEKVTLSVLNEWTCHVKEAVSNRIRQLLLRPQKKQEKAIS